MAVIMLAGAGKISNAPAQTLALTAGATDSISLVVLGRKLAVALTAVHPMRDHQTGCCQVPDPTWGNAFNGTV